MPPVSTTPVTTYTLQYLVKGQASFVQAALSTQRAQDQMARSTRDLNTQQERLTTRLQATQVAITGLIQRELSLTRSINDHAAALGRLMPEYQKRFAQLGALYTRLSAATAAGNANQVRLIQGQINKLAAAHGPLFLEVENLNKALDTERSKLSGVSAELANKRSQVRKLTDALEDLPVLLNESAEAAEDLDDQLRNQGQSSRSATLGQTGFNQSIARGVIEFERFNHRGSMVVRTLEALYRGSTGRPLLGMGGASTATLIKFAAIAVAVTAGIALVGVAIIATVKGVGFLVDSFKNAVAAGIDLAQNGLQAIVNVSSQVITAFAGIAQEALTVVASYEKFVLSSRALLAISLVSEGKFASVGAAMATAGQQAGKLLAWMEKLGIESPFSTADIRQVMQFAQGMGFTESQARRLTTALVDWGSAMGVGGDEMRRVALALGQMSRLGRISSQDVMQLAQVFVDFDGTVARVMGKTPQEIRKMREEGILPVQEALNALVTGMEQDFKGAAATQARSISGLIESLGDLRNIYLREFFGPIDAATLKVGGVLGLVQEKMGDLVDTLRSPALLRAVRSFGSQFEQLARNAFVWGKNLAINYANGIMAGVIFVVRALANIGHVIAYWLSTHSPPRLLPDIDKWGMSTLLAWLKGFTLPNINLFGELSNTLSSVLQSLVIDPKDEGGAKLGILERIFGTRDSIGSVIDQMVKLGKVTDSMVNSVTAAMGSSTPEVAAYVRSMLELELQNTKVTAAQNELNRVTKYYEELLKPIEDELKAIDDAQLALLGGIRTTHLELILNDPNATLEEKELARLEIAKIVAEKKKRLIEAEAKVEIDKAQTALDAELEKQKFLEDQAELQRKLLDQQIEQNRLLQQYLDLIESMKEKADKGGAGAVETPFDPFGFAGAGPLGRKPPSKNVNIFQQFFQPLLNALELLKQTWTLAWDEITKKLGPFKVAWDELALNFSGLVTDIQSDMPMIEMLFGETMGRIIIHAIKWGIVFLTIVNATVTKLREIWAEHGEDITKFVLGLLRLVVAITTSILIWTTAMLYLMTFWFGFFLDLISVNWLEVFMSLPIVAAAALILVWAKVVKWMGEIGTTIIDKMKEVVSWFYSPDRDWGAIGRHFVQGIIDGILSMSGSLYGAISSLVNGMFAAASLAEESKSPSRRAMRELGLPIAQGMALGILKGTPLVAGASAMMVGASVSPPASGNQIANNSTINNSHTDHWSLNVSSTRNSDSIVHDFAIMQAMSGE